MQVSDPETSLQCVIYHADVVPVEENFGQPRVAFSVVAVHHVRYPGVTESIL